MNPYLPLTRRQHRAEVERLCARAGRRPAPWEIRTAYRRYRARWASIAVARGWYLVTTPEGHALVRGLRR